MNDEKIQGFGNIRAHLKVINKNVDEINKTNGGLIDFTISVTVDRLLLYLNMEKLPTRLERIIAQIVDTGLKKCLKNIELSTEVDKAISSLSDKGQSVAYSNEITRYFSTASDEEIFSGFTNLLSRYRRIKVVHPK